MTMVKNIVSKYGEQDGNQNNAFPQAALIASLSPKEIAETCGLGYRAEYIVSFSKEYVNNQSYYENLANYISSSDELFRKLIGIKGVGPYSAGTLMMLLGRYSKLAVDSEMLSFMKKKYFNGKNPTKYEINKIYEDWGKWKYLAYWFDEPVEKKQDINNYEGIHLLF